MALDVLIEAAGRILAAVVLEAIFYWPGWLILRAITLGRYPPPRPASHNHTFVALVGIGALLVGIITYFSIV